MSALPRITIDDRPVTLFGFLNTANAAIEPPAEFTWEVTFGVESPVVTWELTPDDAKYCLGRKEVTITAECPGAPTLVINRVVVIGQTGSVNQRRIAVQFGDIRRYLKYSNPVAALNVRARTGDNSLNGFAATEGNLFIRAIKVYAYRLYSVNTDGSAVNPQQVIKKVMDLAAQNTDDWVLDEPPRATLIPNDILLFDRGDIAVSRMLGTIGGCDLYVDPADGLMHIKNRVMGDEKGTIESFLPPSNKRDVEGWGKIVWRSESHNRPRGFDLVTDPEMEFRSDYVEVAGTQSAPDKDSPFSECVAEVMEYRQGNYQATTPAGKRQCLPGEYLEINQYLATMPNGPLIPTRLGLSDLQNSFMNNNKIYQIVGNGQIPDPGEQARIFSALGNYRQTFRVNRRWTSRCRPGSIRAVMASVSDAENGQRKPSDAYLDFCQIPTLEMALGNSTNALQAWNQDAFPPVGSTANGSEKAYDDGNGSTPTPLYKMFVSPFDVEMIDSDAGTYRIKARPDFLDERIAVVPCQALKIPTLDYTQFNNPGVLALFCWDQVVATANHRLSVVLSAIPGVGEYHTEVSVADAGQRLGVETTPGIAPVMVIRVGQDLLTARFAWSDFSASLIYQAFMGTLAGTVDDPLKTLVPVNLSDIQDYAKGLFAAILANYLDHYEGRQEIPLSPVLPAGSLHAIVHRISKAGYTTTLNCDQVADSFIADHFLSASTLATLRGRVTT